MQNTMVSVWVMALGMQAAFLHAQVINTVAGSTWLFPTSSVPALSAPLGALGSMAADAQGNVYAADSGNNIVIRISPDGVLTVVAGNGAYGFSGDEGPATSASLRRPTAVTIDSAGNLYIVDQGNERIRKVSEGTITTVAGNGVFGFSGDGGAATSASLWNPWGVAVDSVGNLYIADTQNNRVRKVSAETITTVAGNGVGGFSGEGGPATSASLSNPWGLAVDSVGNLYIADQGNHRIRKVSGETITTVVGNGNRGYSGDGGPATSASLNSPSGLTLDSDGNLYTADQGNERIRKVSGGTITTVAGNGVFAFSGDGGSATSASLYSPGGVAVDSAGNLYIAEGNQITTDYRNSRIRKVSDGIITTVAGNGAYRFSGDGGPVTSASLDQPQGVAADSAGNLYIADTFNHRIRKVSGGTITTVAGNGVGGFSGDGGPATNASLRLPSGVAVDSTGTLYIADTGNSRIRKVSGGTITTVVGNGQGFSGDGGPATSALLNNPRGVAIDSAANLYIADDGNNRIRKVSGGTITTVAGDGGAEFSGDGGPAIRASIFSPWAVAVDSAGNLYIADSIHQRIRKVSGGTITTVAGNGNGGGFSGGGYSGDGGPATNASLYFPSGVAVDSAGNLYIADTDNNRIRKVSDGTITTVAGNGKGEGDYGGGHSGDGGPATSASLNLPSGVAVDFAGNLYIADTQNYRIREVFAGEVSYQATPASFSFSASAGGSAPASQTLNFSSSVAGLAFTASTSANWLGVTPSSGSIPAVLAVSANPSGLAAGT